jgi:hypothetical protein
MPLGHQSGAAGVGDHLRIDRESRRPPALAVLSIVPPRVAALVRGVRFLDGAVGGRPVLLSHGSPPSYPHPGLGREVVR